MSERTYLKALCAGLLEEQSKWAYAADSVIGEGFVEIAADTVEGFSNAEMPPGMDVLATHVASFGELWSAFRARVVEDEFSVPAVETFLVLNKIHQICAEDAAGPPKVVESIATLAAQKVPDAQICNIYEWVDGGGNLETWKLQEELAEPGKHVPKDFVHPQEMRRRKALAAAKLKLIELQQRCYLKAEALTTTAPEALEDLLDQNISTGQIARMLRMTPIDVIAACDKIGREPPPLDYDSPHAAKAPQEPELSEEAERSFEAGQKVAVGSVAAAAESEPYSTSTTAEALGDDDQPMTIDQQVIALHEGGQTAKGIVDAMAGAGEEISRQKVTAIIQRFKTDPVVFGA